MDYRLRRQPDGTVNAQPGDAVEYWNMSVMDWCPCVYRTTIVDDQGKIEARMVDAAGMPRIVALEHVRHARGGAGWHRLREARLREVVEAIAAQASDDDLGDAGSMVLIFPADLKAVLADLDNAEPEA